MSEIFSEYRIEIRSLGHDLILAGMPTKRRQHRSSIQAGISGRVGLLDPGPASSHKKVMPLPTIFGTETTPENYAAGLTNVPPYWGLNSGQKNRGTWEKVAIGDTILFKVQGRYRASARVTHKLVNSSLAARIWGENSYGGIWTLLFELSTPTRLSVPVELEQVLGKHPGMRRIPMDRINGVVSRIGLDEFKHVFGIRGWNGPQVIGKVSDRSLDSDA